MARPEMKPFYNSQAWQMARAQALKRDGYTCAYCGARATEVHHLTEINPQNVKRIGLDPSNLQSLCHACHREITMQEHPSRGKLRRDANVGYYFDANGYLRSYKDREKNNKNETETPEKK